MRAPDDSPIRLDALSDHQRRVVESHLPLVQHTMNRHRHLIRAGRDSRDAAELFQEGCLALIDAVRYHEPHRHGHFAAFAMARIHFALSRHVHENEGAVRVPFITQRRRRAESSERPGGSRSGAPLPVVQRLGESSAAATAISRESPDGSRRIGELIGERLDAAMTRVIDEMKTARRCAPDTREVVERCASERWGIPEPEARESIRKLAKSLNCSVGRITHCEERFRRCMSRALNEDEQFVALRDAARRAERGFDEPMSRERVAKLRPLAKSETPSNDIDRDAARRKRSDPAETRSRCDRMRRE